MHKNQQGALRANALGAEMEGVCRDEGRAVFVPGLLPGEEGLVRIVKEQKRFAFGRLMAPPTVPSPDRREPDCPAYSRCGGCSCRGCPNHGHCLAHPCQRNCGECCPDCARSHACRTCRTCGPAHGGAQVHH